ncbi:hypothetical protein C4M97_01120 [Mycoplasmopsis pullorum]|uniref:helix-turn-helix domain-containing protein n=1 Tax=Mycoplasmopsis pullorum TaxID=48003 RepID=UPI00111B4B2B|nr:DnaA/Hda family protein [Mycoplasmopsis pullorum]TNK84447.1 hypothetical protein C4M81_02190 [Mycoplasmopsis pullorum]TNK87197.1 hypothetical protein C4M82_00080 [Mycoplasmopsis pullorum]TNK88992.1 hypothetical protein C4M89_00935 [Mycoplasmopsis pullorum]TNK89294.1 hypothetical protein C4M97_01120 [Mycoplasmopsis pullorum]
MNNKNQKELDFFTREFLSRVRNELDTDRLTYKTLFSSWKAVKKEGLDVYFETTIPEKRLSEVKTFYKNLLKKVFEDLGGVEDLKFHIKSVSTNYIQEKISNEEIESIQEEDKINIFESNNLVLPKTINEDEVVLPQKGEKKKKIIKESQIIPYSDYNFDNFFIADFNDEVTYISKQIIKNEFDFPILFISSQSGMGKTHLLKTICAELQNKNINALYINETSFSEKATKILLENKVAEKSKFLNFFNSLDVLILDDLQNFSYGNKKSTLRFLFNIIDNRINDKKITIIGCEKGIDELTIEFEDRIISRLKSGILTSINKPTNKDYLKYLDYYLKSKNFDPSLLSDESKEFIVRNHNKNIRELSGGLNRIVFFKKDFLENKNDFYYVRKCFENITKTIDKISPNAVIDTVGKYYKINKKDIIGKSRNSSFVVARHISMYLCREVLEMSFEAIGDFFSRDHSSVVHAHKKIKRQLSTNSSTERTVKELSEDIKNYN